MRILHLITDHQVTERRLSEFEKQFPGCNDVLVFAENPTFKHLSIHSSSILVNKKNIKKIRRSFDYIKYNYIVIHYLTFEMVDFVEYAPDSIHVSWEIYGYDLYNQFLDPMGYKVQQEDASKYLPVHARLMKVLGLYGVYLYLKTGDCTHIPILSKHYFRRITSRLNSVIVGCQADASLLEKYSRRTFDTYRVFFYSLREVLGDLYDSPFYDNKEIMIGNSASYSNNHLYVLDLIKSFNIGDTTVIMPISYGGSLRYREKVKEAYTKVFPNQMRFIIDYLPLHEYNKIFVDISVLVLASWRQESIGTIIMGFYLGIKIFLSNKSPLFDSLRKDGFIVYDIEGTNSEDFAKPLKLNQKEHNRNLLLEHYNVKLFEEELKRQFT